MRPLYFFRAPANSDQRVSVAEDVNMPRVGDALGRQQLLQMRRMVGLSTRLASRLLLDDWLGRTQRIGRRRQRGIAAIGAESGLQRRQTLFQLGNASLKRSDEGIPLATSLADRAIHADMLLNQGGRSCASLPKKSEFR